MEPGPQGFRHTQLGASGYWGLNYWEEDRKGVWIVGGRGRDSQKAAERGPCRDVRWPLGAHSFEESSQHPWSDTGGSDTWGSVQGAGTP